MNTNVLFCHNMNTICIVGKGSSLLSRKIGSIIDSHDIIIRVNHLPDNSNFDHIGRKTSIFSTRSPDKLVKHINQLTNSCIWICSNLIEEYTQPISSQLEFTSDEEMEYLKKIFSNFSNRKQIKNNILFDTVLPCAGINSILLAILRFPSHEINVCGIDLYQNGNISIDGVKGGSNIFSNPGLQQMIYYKTLIKSGRIKEL